MLTRQLASAGSGKTYTLARQYIRFLISIQEENKPRRLRKKRELAEAASHILAITFTNKATSEMKDRIVAKLAALADHSTAPSADYMKEFTAELHVSADKISEACKIALDHLLNDFSQFNVTTIDSFFQSVLRTFAYETDLNDNYGVEIGTETLSALAIEEMLNGLNSGTGKKDYAEPILSLLINLNQKKNRSGWNLFQRRESKFSAYSELLASLRNIDNDKFRSIYDSLCNYFFDKEGMAPYTLYVRLKELSETPVAEAWEKVVISGRELANLFLEKGLDIKAQGRAYMHSHVKLALNPDWENVISDVKKKKTPASSDIKTFYSSKESKKLSADSVLTDRITAAGTLFYDNINYFKDLVENPKGAYHYWEIYRENLPLLGMLLLVSRFIRSYTSDHNLVQLSDTNTILSRIIAKDDTPFIYERLGARLDHFLIDEFQDTSLMQWENLYPLLFESESRNQENLIIGDAKQSIYRFRNADSSIITDLVPSLFNAQMKDAGNSAAENTNWRSKRRVVEFNNLVFRYLSDSLGPQFSRLYCNTVQPPHNTETSGYIEINFTPSPETSPNDDDETKAAIYYESLHLGERVAEMRSRGYRYKDIAFLVRKNVQGERVIQALMDYNSKAGPGVEKIQFVSEESLKIDSSSAVRIIIDALQSIVSGTPFRIPDFPSASMLDSEADPSSDSFINLDALLHSMQSTVLPALVETIAEKCIPKELRCDEAPFLAAFQDEVLAYCDSHPADIASFLTWWKERKKTASITSPEDTDAVRIMTIHKSKGLEFDCVIIPELSEDFNKGKSRKWTWVKPENPWGDAIKLPDYLPVNISSALTGTAHEDLLSSFRVEEAVDSLNATYVALTRAVKELYIFLPCPQEINPNKLGNTKLWQMLYQLLDNAPEIISASASADRPYLPSPDEIKKLSDLRFSFGEKFVIESSAPVNQSSDGNDINRSLPIREYHINASLPILQFVETDENGSAATLPSQEAREEGTQFHAVMANIITAADIDKALQKARISGAVSSAWINQNREFIEKAIASVEQYGWFSPGVKVLNERSLATRGNRSGKVIVKRPDRIMLHPDGKAIIVDFKFGEPNSEYIKQVRDYASIMRRCNGVTSVEGYLWYVSLGRVEKIQFGNFTRKD
ncbi:MAG: UvrD-helicase domain-containing protein [Bacteroidales bacterium]|nr:UvrD-helicase domain-containing protein [Bacteroidales bacterium]